LFLNNVVLYSELKHCGTRFLVRTFLEEGFRNLSHSTCPKSGSLLRISLPVFCTLWAQIQFKNIYFAGHVVLTAERGMRDLQVCCLS